MIVSAFFMSLSENKARSEAKNTIQPFMSRLTIFCILTLNSLCQVGLHAQKYRSPVDGPILLSGTFCELRTDHFHTGIDIKSSDGSEGDPIYAITDGYISRIKVSSGGYGMALYVRHNDGLSSLYGHLSRFTDEVEAYVDAYARNNELYEFTIDLDSSEFPVDEGQLLAHMGNTGYSFGPHLHFEIRNHDYSVGYNALAYIENVKDQSCPHIKRIAISSLTDRGDSHVHNFINTRQDESCNYALEATNPLYVQGQKLGVSLLVHDQQEGTSNQNGIYRLKLWVDDSLQHEFVMDSTTFSKARQINSHMNYRLWRDTKLRYHKCFLNEWNDLGIYKKVNLGIRLFEHRKSEIRIECYDYFDNKSSLRFDVQSGGVFSPPPKVYNYRISRQQKHDLDLRPFSIIIPDEAAAKDLKVYITTSSDSSKVSAIPDQIHIHNCDDFLYKPIRLSYKLTDKQMKMAHKLCFINRCSKGKPRALTTNFDESSQTIAAESWSFGDFEIALDTIAPTVERIEGGRTIKFILKDETWAISDLDYRVSCEGEYVAAYLDAKSQQLSISPNDDQRNKQCQINVVDPLGNQVLFTFRPSE